MAWKVGLMWLAAKHDLTSSAAVDAGRDARMKRIAAFVVTHEREIAGYIQAERKRRKAARRG